jgi:hypothetical protein
MVLIALALICVVTVPLTGGSLARLADIRLRGLWIPMIALAVQVIITVVVPTGSMTLHRGLHVASYVMIGLFLWANRRLPGIGLLTLGAACNAIAIFANLGVMPASRSAERLAGLSLRAGFDNSAPVQHAHLSWLGDVIPWPGPLHNVLSVGDLLIFAGTAVFLHRCCRRDPAPPASLLLESEADSHLDLEVGDLAALDVPADRADLDPVEVAQRAAGALHA